MLGLKAVQPVCPYTRYQVLTHGRPVADVRLVPHGRLGDVLKPVVQPLRDAPSPARLRDVALVPLAL